MPSSNQSATRRREYLQRINDVDCGSFVPMIMSSTGAIGPEMSMAIKTLVGRLADKRKEAPSYVTGIVRARFAFALARSALICLRGSRSRWSSGRSFAEVLETLPRLCPAVPGSTATKPQAGAQSPTRVALGATPPSVTSRQSAQLLFLLFFSFWFGL